MDEGRNRENPETLKHRSEGRKSNMTGYMSKSEKEHKIEKRREKEVNKKGTESSAKRPNLYLGTKINPAWETRTLNINPVTREDTSRFLRNEQHTQRWSILSQMFYILLYNLRRLPFLWSILIFLVEVIVPFILPKGTPRRSWYSTAVPLVVSLFMSFFLNILEFNKRYKLGRYLDNKKCLLLKDGKLSVVRSANVIVGNIIKLNCDEQVPADSVILYSSNPDGAVYLDTCYLDGQTDLKTKYSVKDTKMESSLRSYHNLRGNIVCDKPSPDMNKFSGLLKIKGYPRPCMICVDNFVMRGSILRNTSYVYAVVVYTGPDTKASQNFLRILKPIKIGCLEQTINKISILLGFIYLLCTISSVVVRYVNVDKGLGKFNRNVQSSIDSFLFVLFRFVVIYSPIIPTTLPAIMDLLRLLYLPFYDSHLNVKTEPEIREEEYDGEEHFYDDEDIKSEQVENSKSKGKEKTDAGQVSENNRGTWTLNSGLCEELGMVDFIFTDKTGTLTTNNLNITLVTILNKSYTPVQLIEMYNDREQENKRQQSEQKEGGEEEGEQELVKGIKFIESEEERAREHFMRMLVICNPCLNGEGLESFNTLTSSYNTNFSKASSFKFSHFKTKSFNLHDSSPSINVSDELLELEEPTPEHTNNDNNYNTNEDDNNNNNNDSNNLNNYDNKNSSNYEDNNYSHNNSSNYDNNSNDYNNNDGNNNLENINEQEDENKNNEGDDKKEEEEEEDDLDNLPLFKKTKSKAHFGTVSYINLNHPTMSHDFLDINKYGTMNEEDRIYLNCISKEDECMVNLAKRSGYKVVSRNKDKIVVSCHGRSVNYELVGINEFTSTRKRMSVLVTNGADQENYLYVKGEPNTMMERIGEESARMTIRSRLRKNSIFGYRIIICAYRKLTPTELLEYQGELSANVPGNSELREEYLNELEDELEYLGIIMFRDEIQRDITNTIDLLMDAGIRIWVLTGDTKESTIQTCYLTKLLNVPTHLFIIELTDARERGPSERRRCADADENSESTQNEDSNLESLNKQLLENGSKELLDDLEEEEEEHAQSSSETNREELMYDEIYNKFLVERSNRNNEQLCLVIENRNLEIIMNSTKGQNTLVNMACSSDVVLGCLLTPVQKGQLVQLIRTKLIPTPITLAIGDGINDIQMLQHSHISICLQLSNSKLEEDTLSMKNENFNLNKREELKKDYKRILSNDIIGYCDFCVNNFSNLRNLLFGQGTRILRTMSLVIYFTIFKSLILILPIFYYQLFTNWVGLDLYGSFINIAYNLVFTFIPLVLTMLFYQDIDHNLYLKLPLLYTLSRRRIYLNFTNSTFWILEGIVGSLINYVPLHLMVVTNDNVFKTEIISNRTFGLLVSVSSIVIFNTRLMVNYNPNNVLFNVLGVLYYFLSVPMYLGLTWVTGKRALSVSSYQLMRTGPFYFLIPIWITFTLIMALLSNLFQLYLLPNLVKYLKSYINVTGDERKTNIVESVVESLTDLRNVFNLYGSEVVKKMIPASRPFKVKNVPHFGFNKGDKNEENNINKLINMYTLRFKDIQLESDYRLDKNKKHYYENGHWYKIVFILLFVFYLYGFLTDYLVQRAWFRAPIIYSIIPTILLELVLVVCIVVSFHQNLFIRFINHILYSLVTFMILQHLANRFLLKSISWLHPILFPIFTFVILRISFVLSVITNAIFFVGTLIAISNNIHVIPLFIGINIFVGFVGYGLEYKSRSNFIMEFSVVNYRKKQSELLNTMLPKAVVSKMINAKLNENGIPIGFEAESHENVSVIFADVYNFQNLVSTVEPHKLVEILDSLFLCFDRCSKEFKATKIETVSETYLTSIGLKHTKNVSISSDGWSKRRKKTKRNKSSSLENQEDEQDKNAKENDGQLSASMAIDMSIAMLQISTTIKINNNERIGVKIGINTGYVISGLVGSKKPQYALFGDTVNTASRMKMTGEVNKIHISESTYQMVKDDKTLEFEEREIEVKGKGIMRTYLLKRALGSSYPDFAPFSAGTTMYELDTYYDRLSRMNPNISNANINPNNEGDEGSSNINHEQEEENNNNNMNNSNEDMENESLQTKDQLKNDRELFSKSKPVISINMRSNLNNENGEENEDEAGEFNIGEEFLKEEMDMERIRNRRININRALGNELEELEYFANSPYYEMSQYSNLNTLYADSYSESGRSKRGKSKRFHGIFKRKTRQRTSRVVGMGTTKFSSMKTTALSSSSTTSGNKLSRRMFSSISTVNLKRSTRLSARQGRRPSLEHTEGSMDEIHMKKVESILLRFNDKLQEDRYKNNFYNSTNNVSINEHALFIFLITFIAQTIVNLNIPRIYSENGLKYIIYLNYPLYWTVRCFFVLISFVLWLLFHYNFFSHRKGAEPERVTGIGGKLAYSAALSDYKGDQRIKLFTFFLNLLLVTATCMFALSNSWSIKRSEEINVNLWMNSDSIEFYFYIVLLHHSTGLLFQNFLLIDALFLILSMTFISTSVKSTATTTMALFTVPICILFNLLSSHCKESIDRKTFFTNEKAYMIETRVNQILNEMLPKSILEEFKQEKLKMCYLHNNMSFLFSDICGFTSWAHSVDPSEVIALLQKLFANFDRNTTNFNLYKLCTIGDAYVAISDPYLTNTNDLRLNDLMNVLQMAYSMLHIIQETRELFNIPNLNMRIGLHYGSCIGGVIGSGRLRYDVWGKDINVANMVESNGVAGSICVSEAFLDIVQTHFPNRFSFKFHREIEVIDQKVNIYLLESDNQDSYLI